MPTVNERDYRIAFVTYVNMRAHERIVRVNRWELPTPGDFLGLLDGRVSTDVTGSWYSERVITEEGKRHMDMMLSPHAEALFKAWVIQYDAGRPE